MGRRGGIRIMGVGVSRDGNGVGFEGEEEEDGLGSKR